MKRFLLSLILVSQPLLAAAPTGHATFAPGTAVPAKLVVNESLWTCADGRCSGPAETRLVALKRACADLAHSVGPVVSLTAGGAALAPDAVQACNVKNGRAPESYAAAK